LKTLLLFKPFLVIFWLLGYIYAHGQDVSHKFTHFGKQDGLNQSSVNFIFQDSQDYVWIANFGGINRFDGYAFTSYANDFDDKNSIPDNSVWSIFERKNQTLWFGTKAGLSRFNRTSNNFTNYFIRQTSESVGTLSIKALFEDSKSRFYIGTEGEGLYLFDEASETFSIVKNIPELAKVSSISEDTLGNLWVGTENLGVFKIDVSRDKATSLLKNKSLSSETVWSVLCDSKGNVWVGTDAKGLVKFNTTTNTTIIYKDTPKQYNYSSGTKIKTITEDADGNIWIGSATEGLSFFSNEEGVFHRYKTNPFDSNSLFDNDVSSLFSGNNNELYVGLYTKGFDKLIKTPFHSIKNNQNESNTLSNNNVYSIYKDSEEQLWFGTFGGGLNKYDPVTKSFKHYRYDVNNRSSISHDWIRIIYEDKSGTLWIGTWGGGLNKFDKETERFERYLPDSKSSNSLNHNIVTALFEDEDGELWIGTYGGGINIYRPETNDFKSIVHNKSDKNSISDDHITSFFQGENGLIWICTYGGGINSFHKKTNTFKRYLPDSKKAFSLNNHKALHIYKEADSSFYWITTLGGGINKFFYKENKFENFTEKDGLSNNSTMGMLKDDANTYWISSNTGISRFNPDDETFQNYTTADGLASDDYNLEAYAKTKNGTFYFGGKNGVTFFHPNAVKDAVNFQNVIITAVKVEDSLYRIGTKKPQIPYKSRVSFDYAVINAANVNNIKYAYQLIGQDKDWRQMNKNRHLEFTNLNPGDYELRLKSTNSNSIWNTKYTSFSFTVPAPWYMTWFFRIASVLLVLISIYSYYRIKLTNARKRNIKLENKVRTRTKTIKEKNIALAKEKKKTEEANEQLKELNYLKDRILSILSHDIKSPLFNLETLLKLFEGDNRENTIKNMPRYTAMIQLELNKVQTLLNNLLMWAKYQVTNVKAVKEELKLYYVVEELYHLFETKAESKSLQLTNTLNPDEIIESDRNIISFLLRNLIFNAIKFTPEHGEIKVECKVVDEMYHISVVDSGVGMTEEQAQNIFSNDTISWKQGTSGEKGTGLGLILCKDLAEELNGSIWASSTLGKGSVFTFEFPV